GGTSSTPGSGNDYSYDVPSVTTLVPNHGPAAGGYQVTIGGTEFTGTTSVKFGAASASAVNVVNDSTITVNAPAGTAGSTVDVTVVTPNGTSPTAGTANDFSYDPILPPTVTGLSPTHGPATGGNQVTITGTGFAGTTAVKFGPNSASSVQVLNNATITVNAPAGAGESTVDVTVTTPVGSNPSAGTGNDYTYDVVVPKAISPNTFLTHHPKHRIHKRQVAFAFSSDMPGVSYQCFYAHGWADCNSPQTFRHLKPGRYQFRVKAIVNGVEDPTPASWTFRVRR
ncbi:MAG: IPT/TIG domain-containing protein, partial [Actinomycetota bacterium]|nr:IPT/TIG domain-containing protein [Actinomycetota bacterium]